MAWVIKRTVRWPSGHTSEVIKDGARKYKVSVSDQETWEADSLKELLHEIHLAGGVITTRREAM